MKKKIRPSLSLQRKRQRKKARRERRLLLHAERQARRFDKYMLRLGGTAPAIPLAAPRIFCLRYEHHQHLVPFLRELVRLTLTQERVVCIDFRSTEKFVADGALLFHAEVERILARRPRSIQCLRPRDPVCQQVLSHLGLLRSMGDSRLVPSERDDVLHWKVVSGTKADATTGLGSAIEDVPGLPADQTRKLFRSVTEALTNVTQHAYLEPRRDGTGTTEPSDRRWWMYVRQEPGELTVVFCDLGVGVPYTVSRLEKHSGWLEARLASMFRPLRGRRHHDGQIIQATVEEKLSRFEIEHRGNGFANMIETIDVAGDGRVDIISNRGSYTYERDLSGKRASSRSHSHSIYGTVVAWKLALPPQVALPLEAP